MHYSQSVEIMAPPEDVWRHLRERVGEWPRESGRSARHGVEGTEPAPRQERRGRHEGGSRFPQSPVEIVTFDPPHQLSWRYAGGLAAPTVEGQLRIWESGLDRATLAISLDYHPKGAIGRFFEPFVRLLIGPMLARICQEVKRRSESGRSR